MYKYAAKGWITWLGNPWVSDQIPSCDSRSKVTRYGQVNGQIWYDWMEMVQLEQVPLDSKMLHGLLWLEMVQYKKSKEPPKCTGLFLLDKWIEYSFDH